MIQTNIPAPTAPTSTTAFATALRTAGFAGDIRMDHASRAAMATDNSVYQLEPDIIVAPREAAEFVERCRTVHGLLIGGLMCIPPAGEAAGPHFALLAKMAAEVGVENLSMGMSGDFETAIAFGATHVRVGGAIFGSRPPVVASPEEPAG